MWIDDEVRDHMRLRDQYKSQKLWDFYKTERNLVTNMIKRKKKKYMTKLVENSKGHNTKSLWNALNVGNKTKTYIDNAAGISSSHLNEHFTSIAAKLSKDFSLISDFSSTLPNYHHKGLKQFPKLTTFSLHNLLKSIPIGKSTGPDQISVRMLN